MNCPICGKQSLSSSNLYCREHNKEKLVEEYLNTIALRLSADYGLSFEVATRAVEDLDLLNIYKGDYDFVLLEDISTWADIAFDRYKTKELKYKLNTDKPIFLTPTLEKVIENMKKKKVEPNNRLEERKKALKENTMDNYIVINGKKEELTEEQLNYLCMFNRFAQMAKERFGLTITPKETAGETFKTLFGVDFSDCSERKNPFNSELEDEDSYFLIDDEGVNTGCYNPIIDKHRLDNINSFNDKDFANQVYLYELLNRKLLKYAWDNEAEDGEWNGENLHYYIFLDTLSNEFRVEDYFNAKTLSTIHFSNKKVAKQAIKYVIETFMKEHPEFVW